MSPARRPPPVSAGVDLPGLVRLLAAATDPSDATAGVGETVLLDLTVDGLRCVLTVPSVVRQPGMLSPREREVARMVANGYTNRLIADVLDISAWTVSTHMRRIFAKLGVSSRAAMVAQVLSDGALSERPAGQPALRADSPRRPRPR